MIPAPAGQRRTPLSLEPRTQAPADERKPPAVEVVSHRPPATTDAQIVDAYWHTRRCFACGVQGYCTHREPEVARAEVERWKGARP